MKLRFPSAWLVLLVSVLTDRAQPVYSLLLPPPQTTKLATFSASTRTIGWLTSTSLRNEAVATPDTSTKMNRNQSTFVINDKIRAITKTLINQKNGQYSSSALDEDQYDEAKYAIQAWSQVTSSASDIKNSATNIQRILQRLEYEKKNGNEAIDTQYCKIYSSVIDKFSKAGFPDCAESLLKQMQTTADGCSDFTEANVSPYNTIIHSFKRNGQGERAEDVLKMMRKNNIEPDAISFNGVVLAYARNCNKRGYADKAQQVLEQMEDSDVDIDPFLYNAVMDAHAKTKNNDSARKAEILLSKMEEYGNDNDDIKPNTISYTTVIDAYAKMGMTDSSANAERVFRKMESSYKAGNVNARPNAQSFNALINSYVQSNQPGNALKAEKLLMKMLDLSKKGFEGVRPNVVSFTTVINGWARSGEAGSGMRAQKIFDIALQEYEEGNKEALANSFMYSALIDAWIKCRDEGSVDRAFAIFSGLNDSFKHGDGSVKPSTFLANQIMDALSKSGKSGMGERVEDILAILDSLYNQDKDSTCKPNDRTYTIAMNAWARSRSFGKAQRAYQLLIKMEKAFKEGNRDAKPNIFAYTTVLNACAFTVGDLVEKKEALQIATTTYKKLVSSDIKPNSVFFATFLRVCLNLIPRGASQQSAINTVFKRCCEHGQVNDLILDIVVRSVPDDQVKAIVGLETRGGSISIDRIPKEWKCNVDERTNRSRRRERVRR